ncbi:MAG TPA: EVE domain-containing protein [Urbifossiella sp.]|nr:EVE domain-containing protein [Urbifossiella sp.]
MALWLFKQEPSCYSWSDLHRDGSTNWDGVANAVAQKHLRSVKKGDRVFFYHTGKEKAIVGIMQVSSDPTADPGDPAGKQVAVAMKPLKELKHPVPLAAIKADPAFASWELVRISRLSVMPVPEAIWKKIEAMSEEE